MSTPKQARISLKMALAQRDLTVTKLAKRVGYTREAVSRAINQGRNPGVLVKVKEALRVA